jgi:4-hydroxy-4-methyl-2-oxoglutarate aldolase
MPSVNGQGAMRSYHRIGLLVWFACGAQAQLGLFSPPQRIELTRAWKGDRFPDGRPKVPDSILRRMKTVSAEEAWKVIQEAGFRDQFERGWQRFNASNDRLVGRAVTALFLPVRPDVDGVIRDHGKAEGRVGPGENSWVIDTLQPGDVLVVDEYEKYGFMGDNLATAVFTKSRNGIVVNGSVRDVTGISEIKGFTGYVRGFHPSSVTHGVRNVMLMGINVPVRIGDTTVMPGDVVLGDPEGLMFVPPQLAEKVVAHAEDVHLRDEWGHMMLRQGKYTPGQIDTRWTAAMEEEFRRWVQQNKKSSQ